MNIRYELCKLQTFDCEALDEELQKIVQDLVVLSVVKFNRVKLIDDYDTDIFDEHVCICIYFAVEASGFAVQYAIRVYLCKRVMVVGSIAAGGDESQDEFDEFLALCE